mmetsp:Transcript_2177/g.5009  ORF Transcript_2177/g.5009 Transcript_2177/m.5009 type:complete len:220 (+) Transcript_2177:1199-1858(+)
MSLPLTEYICPSRSTVRECSVPGKFTLPHSSHCSTMWLRVSSPRGKARFMYWASSSEITHHNSSTVSAWQPGHADCDVAALSHLAHRTSWSETLRVRSCEWASHLGKVTSRHEQQRTTPIRWNSLTLAVSTEVTNTPSVAATLSLSATSGDRAVVLHILRSTRWSCCDTSVKNSSVGPRPVPTSPKYSTSSIDLCAPYSCITRTADSSTRALDTRTFCR